MLNSDFILALICLLFECLLLSSNLGRSSTFVHISDFYLVLFNMVVFKTLDTKWYIFLWRSCTSFASIFWLSNLVGNSFIKIIWIWWFFVTASWFVCLTFLVFVAFIFLHINFLTLIYSQLLSFIERPFRSTFLFHYG